jgi:hypothetical protein
VIGVGLEFRRTMDPRIQNTALSHRIYVEFDPLGFRAWWSVRGVGGMRVK